MITLQDPAGLFALGGEGEVETGEVACSCAVQGMSGPLGVEADHVDRGGGDGVLELGLGQSEVAGPADPGTWVAWRMVPSTPARAA